jgi:hypothetical protein
VGEKPRPFVKDMPLLEDPSKIRKDVDVYIVNSVATTSTPKLEETSVISDYLDEFLEGLPGLPSDRQIKFQMELVPGAAPVPKTSYRLAPTETQELVKQL